jgi:hypothetical protein
MKERIGTTILTDLGLEVPDAQGQKNVATTFNLSYHHPFLFKILWSSLMGDTPLGWYKWYPRDFLASSKVRRMSITARGVYRELLDLQWEDGGVPLTDPEARAIINATIKEWEQFSPYFSECFPNGKNSKLAEQRDAAIAARNKQIESGKAGGKLAGKGRPKGKSGVSQGSVRGIPNQTETETEYISFFERVQKEYPKRDGDLGWTKARTKIVSIPLSQMDAVIAGVIGYRKYLESKGKIGTEFVKQATTFFNQEVWKEYQPKAPTVSPERKLVILDNGDVVEEL